MTPARWAAGAAAVVLGAAALVSLHLLDVHHDAREAHEALRLAQVARFGPTTRYVVGRYLRAHHAQTLRWQAEAPPGIFGRRARVTLHARLGDAAPDTIFRFDVDLGDGTVAPTDAETQALLTRLRAWADAEESPRK